MLPSQAERFQVPKLQCEHKSENALAECSAQQFKKVFLSKSFEIVLNSFFMPSSVSLVDQEWKKKGHALRNFKSVSILK